MEDFTNKDNKKTLSNNPEYFGAFLNMARHNIFIINNHLAKKFEITELPDEAQITSSFLIDLQNRKIKSKQNHVLASLKRFIPIVKVFDDETLPNSEKENIDKFYGKDFDTLSRTLKTVFKEISDFRNDYTHYFSIANEGVRKLEISDDLKLFLNKNYKRAIEYTKTRFATVYTDIDFEVASNKILVNEDNVITQDGLVFLTSIFLDRENAFQFANRITGLKSTQYKSFTAQREVLSAFCVKLPSDKFVSEDNLQAFSLELINELNKCPKTLYHVISETDKKQFHPTIGVEEIENILESSVPDTIDDYEDYIENITKKVRSKNRFDYFALKFLDDTHVFKNFRFQIDLGKLILDEYQKPLNGIEEERKVVENVKAFGRLQDFRNNEENLINEINRSDSNLCFEQFAPHYNFDTNKIGLAFFDDNHKKGMKSYATFTVKVNKPKKVKAHLEQPEITAFLSTNELSKIILLEYLEKGKSEKLIKDFITINDSTIFNLEFIETVKTKMADLNKFYKKSQGRRNKHAYILKIENNKEKIDIEKINDLKNRKETLNLVLEEYALNEKQIPTRIVDYWLNIIDVRDEIIFSDRIKLMKRNCIDRLKDIKKDKSPKIGEMASFLAKDIIDMIIDPQKKEKITSFYYDKIQQCLALYADEEKRKLLSQIFKELDINGVGGHPFLNRINFQEIKYTQDIYKLYLEEKGQKLSGPHDSSWMQKFFYVKERNEKIGKDLTVVKMPKDISKIPHTIVQFQKEKNSFKDWYKNITEGKEVTDRKKPIDLPTNLFDDSLKLLLQEKLESANIEFDESVNYNKLFKTWWTKCRLDDTQPFYKAKRSYVFEENELVFETNTKPKFKDYCSNDFINKVFKIKGDRRVIEKRSNPKLPHINRAEVAKNIHHKLGTTEKEIRILEEQDRLMLLMFEQLIGVETNPKLKKIDALLNETITIKERVTGKLYFDDKGEEIKDKSQKKDIAKNITENRKRKEFSVLRKYSNDKRLPELFEYFEAENLPVEQLKIELDSYNNAKEIVFDLIFKLEKAIVEKDKIGVLECVEEPKEHLQHKPFLKWLLTKKIITENEYVFMNMIRKTFSHNQFAQKTSIELVLKNWSENKFAMQMVDLYKQKTEQIISEIAVF